MRQIKRVAAFEEVRQLVRLGSNHWVPSIPRCPSLRGSVPHLQDCLDTPECWNLRDLAEPFQRTVPHVRLLLPVLGHEYARGQRVQQLSQPECSHCWSPSTRAHEDSTKILCLVR